MKVIDPSRLVRLILFASIGGVFFPMSGCGSSKPETGSRLVDEPPVVDQAEQARRDEYMRTHPKVPGAR